MAGHFRTPDRAAPALPPSPGAAGTSSSTMSFSARSRSGSSVTMRVYANDYDDGGSSFDWDKDDHLEDDHIDDEEDKRKEAEKRERLLRRTRCGTFLFWFFGFPFYLRTLLYIIIGNGFILAPGLVDFYFFADTKYGLTPDQQRALTFIQRFNRGRSALSVFGIALFQYAVFLSICWTLFFVIRLGVRIAPTVVLKVIEIVLGTYGSNTKHVFDYVKSLHGYLSFALWMWALYTTFKALLVPEFWAPDGGAHRLRDQANEVLVNNILLSGAIGAALLAGEKLIVQVIAVRFHRHAYRDRIKENKRAAHVLEKLENFRKNGKLGIRVAPRASSVAAAGSITTPPFLQEAKLRGADPNAVTPSEDELPETDSCSETSQRGGTRRAKRQRRKRNVVKDISHFVSENVLHTDWSIAALSSKDEARRLARKIFEAYCPPTREHLFPGDFLEVFPNLRERDNAFRIFDKDGNGDISKAEIKAAVLSVYREKKVIDRSLRSVNNAVGKLDSIFMVILFLMIVLITLSVFNVSLQAFLTSVGSLLVAATFMFGSSAKTLFESTVFLFVTHPYDVGDRVDIAVSDTNKLKLIVQDMGLLTTTFRTIDGKEYYAPNAVLATKFIHNVRRSGNQTDQLLINVDPLTSRDKLQRFRDHLHQMIEKEGRDFTGKFEIVVDEMVDMQRMTLRVVVEHRSNWQDGPRKRMRTSKLYLAIRDALQAVGICWMPSTMAALEDCFRMASVKKG